MPRWVSAIPTVEEVRERGGWGCVDGCSLQNHHFPEKRERLIPIILTPQSHWIRALIWSQIIGWAFWVLKVLCAIPWNKSPESLGGSCTAIREEVDEGPLVSGPSVPNVDCSLWKSILNLQLGKRDLYSEQVTGLRYWLNIKADLPELQQTGLTGTQRSLVATARLSRSAQSPRALAYGNRHRFGTDSQLSHSGVSHYCHLQ